MSTKLIRTMTAAMVFGLAGSAWAQGPFYWSVGNGNWGTNGTWEQAATQGGSRSAASEPPGTGDTVVTTHNVTVAAGAQCADLTISSGTLTIGGQLAVVTLAVTGNATFTGSFAVASKGIFDLTGTASFSGSPVCTVASSGIFKVNGTSMTIGSNNFTVDSGGELALVGTTAPNVNVGSGLVLNGRLTMTCSHVSNPAYIVVPSTRSLPSSATGEIRGLAAAAVQPEIHIDSGVTMTNPGTIAGYLKIMGSSAGVGIFANNGTVVANQQAKQLLVASSLSSISDNGSAIWSANYNDASTELRIDEAAASLAGQFQLNTGAGRLAFGATVGNTSAPNWLVNAGTVIVDASCAFHYATPTGSCGSKPGSAGSLSAGTYNYCLP